MSVEVQKRKTGLVLEGGAMRGMYTAGVLDVFTEHGISFDGVIGVSMGAITGCSFLSGQKGRTIRYNKTYCKDKRYMSFYSLLTTGDLVGNEFCYHTLPEVLDPYDNEAFKKSQTDFYVTCTNVETGEAEYLKVTDMVEEIDYLRASASMPYVSRIVEIGGKKFLDGGCSDSIPIRAFVEMGYEKNVVILTRPEEYRKKPENKRLVRLFYKKYPKFAETLEQRATGYNRTVEEILKLEQQGKVFVIRPETPLDIGRMSHDVKKIEGAYERGCADGLACLTKLTEWLNAEENTGKNLRSRL